MYPEHDLLPNGPAPSGLRVSAAGEASGLSERLALTLHPKADSCANSPSEQSDSLRVQ